MPDRAVAGGGDDDVRLETKEFDCLESEMKALDGEEPGTFVGMGAVFGNRDFVNDVIAPGAFAKSLKAFARKNRLPPLLWSHNTDEPLGRFLEMEETSRGLKVTGKLNLKVQRAAEAHALLQDRDVTGLSIGFRIPEKGFEFDPKKNIRTLTEIDLMEVSIVSIPANDIARIGAVKEWLPEECSPEMVRTKRELEKALRDGRFSKSFAAYVAAYWQPPAQRDAEGESLQALIASAKQRNKPFRAA